MSYNRFDKSNDANELGIVKALEAVGALVYRIGRPVDLLVGYDRQWIPMEVKQPKGKLTPTQEEFFEATADHGLVAAVVRNATEALALIGCETRGVEIGHRVPVTSPWLDGNTNGGE